MRAIFDMDALSALAPLVARTRQTGDFIRPLGMQGRKSLQDLFVDARIPVRLRDIIVAVALAGQREVLWIPGQGGRRSACAPIGPDTKRVLRLEFVRSKEGQTDGIAKP